MEEQLISYDTAVLAKEKGFNTRVWTCYSLKYKDLMSTYDLNNISCEGGFDFDDFFRDYNNAPTLEQYFEYSLISAPTQSLLQKWIRERHNIHINVYFSSGLYWLEYRDNERFLSKLGLKYYSYEEALEDGLQEALKLINT